jgi:hypothetical protein
VSACVLRERDAEEAEKQVVDRFQHFLDQHEFVPDGEPYLVVVCGYGRGCKRVQQDWTWILRKRRAAAKLHE